MYHFRERWREAIYFDDTDVTERDILTYITTVGFDTLENYLISHDFCCWKFFRTMWKHNLNTTVIN